jgi:hypothetical protein
MYRLQNELNLELCFVDAPVETETHDTVKEFYDKPCYRNFHWAPSPIPFDMQQVRDAYKFWYKVIEEQGPFDGVMGFSQGSVISVALLLHHAEEHPEAPPTDLFRFAILFSCPYLPWPEPGTGPEDIDWGRIQTPSLHICGKADEEWGEAALYTFWENCEEGTATLYQHSDGHTIPKDKASVDKIIGEIGKFVKEAM